MRLRSKLVVSALGILVLGVGVMWPLNSMVIGRGFTRTEATAAAADGRRVADGVGAMQVSLGQLTRLQAVWDDPFQLLSARSADGFAEVYPPSDMWNSYRARYILVVDNSGVVVAGGATDAFADRFGPFPEALADPRAVALFRGGSDQASCGLWRFADEGVYTYCTHAVLPTDGSGDPAGFMTMFQPLDDVTVAQLAARLGLVLRADDERSDVVVEAPGDSRVDVVDGDTLEVHTNLAVNNDPKGMTFVATLGRPVHAQAVSTERNVLLAGAALCAVLLAAFVIAVDRMMLARTRRLGVALGALDAEDPAARLANAGKDELDDLAEAVNRNLAAMQRREERVQAERAEAAEVLEAAEAARYAAIDARIDAESIRASRSARTVVTPTRSPRRPDGEPQRA